MDKSRRGLRAAPHSACPGADRSSSAGAAVTCTEEQMADTTKTTSPEEGVNVNVILRCRFVIVLRHVSFTLL